MKPRSLTQKELEVLVMVRHGARHKHIAHTCEISVSALKLRLASARKKMRAKNACHTVANAISEGLIK